MGASRTSSGSSFAIRRGARGSPQTRRLAASDNGTRRRRRQETSNGSSAGPAAAAPCKTRQHDRRMKVLLATQPMPAAIFIDAIRARAPDVELLEYRSSLSDAELADVDVVLGWQMPSGLPARLPRARWVCSVAAGVEKLLAPDLAPHVRVARIVDREQAAGIAQFVVAMALRHARDLERYDAQQRERVWLRQPTPMARH